MTRYPDIYRRIFEILLLVFAVGVLIGQPILIYTGSTLLDQTEPLFFFRAAALELTALLIVFNTLWVWWRRKMRKEKWRRNISFKERDISDSHIAFTAYAEDVVKEKYVFELVIYHSVRGDGREGFVSQVRVKDNPSFSWNSGFHLGTIYETWRRAKREGEQILEEKVKEDRERW